MSALTSMRFMTARRLHKLAYWIAPPPPDPPLRMDWVPVRGVDGEWDGVTWQWLPVSAAYRMEEYLLA